MGGIKAGGMDRRSADDSGVKSQLNDMQGAMDTLVHTVNNMASKQQVNTISNVLAAIFKNGLLSSVETPRIL